MFIKLPLYKLPYNKIFFTMNTDGTQIKITILKMQKGRDLILLWYLYGRKRNKAHDITFKTERQVNDLDLPHRIPCRKQFFNVPDLDSTFPVIQSDERLLMEHCLCL
jgi:hypothetical protein